MRGALFAERSRLASVGVLERVGESAVVAWREGHCGGNLAFYVRSGCLDRAFGWCHVGSCGRVVLDLEGVSCFVAPRMKLRIFGEFGVVI